MTYLLKSCTLIYENIWVKIFWQRTGGTYMNTHQKSLNRTPPNERKQIQIKVMLGNIDGTEQKKNDYLQNFLSACSEVS